jgi:hypothetical protein
MLYVDLVQSTTGLPDLFCGAGKFGKIWFSCVQHEVMYTYVCTYVCIYIIYLKQSAAESDWVDLIHLTQYKNQKTALFIGCIKYSGFLTGSEFICQLKSYHVLERQSFHWKLQSPCTLCYTHITDLKGMKGVGVGTAFMWSTIGKVMDELLQTRWWNVKNSLSS